MGGARSKGKEEGGTVFKNRLIIYSNEPYSRVKVLEFK
jgi:hypothetical protein